MKKRLPIPKKNKTKFWFKPCNPCQWRFRSDLPYNKMYIASNKKSQGYTKKENPYKIWIGIFDTIRFFFRKKRDSFLKCGISPKKVRLTLTITIKLSLINMPESGKIYISNRHDTMLLYPIYNILINEASKWRFLNFIILKFKDK